MQETFDWLQPSLLWENGPARVRQPGFFHPQILEFRDDNFIDAAASAAAARDTGGFRAAVVAQTGSAPLKLYQPAHGRYYLVVAALSCRLPGFPEREIRSADGESVFFVLRRYIDGAEHGWISDGSKKSWNPLDGDGRKLLDGEERLPLTPMPGSDGRAVLAGYIPVASREAFAVSAVALAAAMSPEEKQKRPHGIDPRIEDLEARFITPLHNNALADPTPTIEAPAVDISVYLLLNLWEFFQTYLPDVAAALRGDPGAPLPSGPSGALMSFLSTQQVTFGNDLATALGAVARQSDALDQAGDAGVAPLGFGASYDLRNSTIDLDRLEAVVAAALPAGAPPVLVPKQGGADVYVIRCVYARPQCANPIAAVSQPSVPFQLAAFFDTEAPARPVRIVLPTDVSIAGMRKFNKGVTFVISDGLQKKINQLTGHERGVIKDPPELGSEDGGLVWICSFSIQIIFIVAFFLLLMFVIILNIAFWWIAFFRICLPLPKKLLPG